MRQARNCIIALLMGCSAPLLIWVGAGVALYERHKQPGMGCSMDTDCPPGYMCINGRCVPDTSGTGALTQA